MTEQASNGRGTPLAAQLATHRLHAALVMYVVDAAFDSVLTVLEASPADDCTDCASWLDGLQRQLPPAMALGGLLRILATADTHFELQPC